MTQSSETPALTPVAPGQRIQVLDILRGFAIFGILLVNMQLFYGSIYSMSPGMHQSAGLADQIAATLITLFAESKFYSTFSFLFGVGMALQLQRAERRGGRFVPFFLRRMGVLLGLGAIHAFLIWTGDILMIYAVVGTILLLLFRTRRPKTLVIWAIVLLTLVALFYGLSWASTLVPEGREAIETAFAGDAVATQALAESADLTYANGTFIEITRQRVSDMAYMSGVAWFMVPNVLALMLLGLAAGKAGVLADIPGRLRLIRRTAVIGGIIGLAGELARTLLGGPAADFSAAGFLGGMAIHTFSAPALALAYMAGIALLVHHSAAWRERLGGVGNIGRMALSNYLFQSIVCTLIFYGYGLGLYGKIGPALGLLLTIVIYLVQIPLSAWWMGRFRFGPFEWLWRTLTYGSLQPIKI